MKIEDLKNTKIYLSNKEDRREFQEKVFKLGIVWNGGYNNTDTMLLEGCFYYIDAYLNLTVDSSNDASFFRKHTNEQIFLDEVLEIEGPELECEFKPFEWVLVRDRYNDKWLPALYAYCDKESSFNHMIIATIAYNQCVPYKGNEHLAGTTNNLE